MIIKRKKAVFFDENGEHEKTTSIKKNSSTLNYGKKTYIVNEKASRLRTEGLIFITDFYFYNVKKEEPLYLSRKQKNVLKPSNLYTIIESDFAYKLSKVAMANDLSKLLTPKNMLIGLGVLVAIIYFASGGTITWRNSQTL